MKGIDTCIYIYVRKKYTRNIDQAKGIIFPRVMRKRNGVKAGWYLVNRCRKVVVVVVKQAYFQRRERCEEKKGEEGEVNRGSNIISIKIGVSVDN